MFLENNENFERFNKLRIWTKSNLDLGKILTKFRKIFISCKIILNILIFLVQTTQLNLRALNLITLSCIEDCSICFAYYLIKILKNKRF